jgi:hypothetical protein
MLSQCGRRGIGFVIITVYTCCWKVAAVDLPSETIRSKCVVSSAKRSGGRPICHRKISHGPLLPPPFQP